MTPLNSGQAPSLRGSIWLTTTQATEYLGLPSPGALYKRVERGQLPAHRFGKQYRFKRSELDALMTGSHR